MHMNLDKILVGLHLKKENYFDLFFSDIYHYFTIIKVEHNVYILYIKISIFIIVSK